MVLKKSGVVLLALIGWLILTTTSALAVSLRDFYNNAPPPLEYLSPRSLSFLKLNPEENNDTTILKELNECIGSKKYCYGSSQLTFPLFATDSLPKFLLLFFPLYFIVFSLNYMLEFSVGLTFHFPKHKRFSLVIFLMNLVTHSLLTMMIMSGFSRIFFNTQLTVLLLELIVMLIEALIFGWWYNRNKPKNTPILTLAQALGFSFVINFASFLVGEIIAWMASLMASSIPSLNYYVLCLIVLIFVITVTWIFRRPHMITKPKISP